MNKRASYREGVAYIACNDDNGAPDAQDVEQVTGYISVQLLATLFGKEPEAVARDVVRYRAKLVGQESLIPVQVQEPRIVYVSYTPDSAHAVGGGAAGTVGGSTSKEKK